MIGTALVCAACSHDRKDHELGHPYLGCVHRGCDCPQMIQVIAREPRSGQVATITLDAADAWALWDWLQSEDGPEYWTCPLAPVADQVKNWIRGGADL